LFLDLHFPGVGRMFRVYKLGPDHPGLKRLTNPGKPDIPRGRNE